MSDSKSSIQLTSYMLTENNWQLWRREVIIGMKRINAHKIMTGNEPAKDSKDSNDWDKRHDQAYHMLILSLSETFKTMTINCDDLPSTWKRLEQHFEVKSAADIMAAEAQLSRLTLSDNDDILSFLNTVRLIQNSIVSAGSDVPDKKLFQAIIMKLPARMANLRDTILYGPEERKTYAALEQTLTSYAKNNPVIAAPEQANTAINNKKQTCTHCKRRGHKVADCRAVNHTCTRCNTTGHFERRCKAERPKARNTHATHYAFEASQSTENSKNLWIVDTGATSSISPHVVPTSRTNCDTVTMADGTQIPATGYGQVDIGIKISNVLCVPSAHRNLLSIGKACDDGNIDRATFDEYGCQLYKNGTIVATGKRKSGLYQINMTPEVNSVTESTSIWHQRLAHLPNRSIQEILSRNLQTGIQISKREPQQNVKCQACETGKSTRLPFKVKDPQKRSNTPGAILHVDLCGPMQVDSIQGSRYAMPIVDECSRFVTIFFMSQKSQAADLILDCITLYQNLHHNNVKIIQADNGGEFTSAYLKSQLVRRGIKLQTTIPYSPEQNGVVERMNRTLVDRARVMLTHAGLPTRYWQFAMAAAAHITNRIPTEANNRNTPFKLWTGQDPNVSHLRVFGCRAYTHIPSQKRQKFDPKAKSCTTEAKTMCELFAVPPATFSRILSNSEEALSIALREIPDAGIRWPSFEQQEQWADATEAREPRVKGVFAFVDGKNLPVQQPSSSDLQNAFYNGESVFDLLFFFIAPRLVT